MRPKTIVYFEWIIFGTLLLSALHNYLSWDQIIGQLGEDASIAVIIFSYALIGTLTLLVSRRRSKIAMWGSIALFAINLCVFLLQSITDGQLGSDVIRTALETIGEVVACSLLFTPSARRWMRREDEKLREVFH